MTNNTNRKHPIAKLINVVIILIAVIGMSMGTVRFVTSTWCNKIFGISVNEQSDWTVKACAKYYWDIDLENLGRW